MKKNFIFSIIPMYLSNTSRTTMILVEIILNNLEILKVLNFIRKVEFQIVYNINYILVFCALVKKILES